MRIAIIGAGIGGLSVALALKVKGFRAEIFESAAELRAVGAGIWMPPNAMTILDNLGAGEAIRQYGCELRQLEIRDIHDQKISRVDGSWLKERYGSQTISIERSILHRCIFDRLDSDQIHLGMECVSVIQTDEMVSLKFGNQMERSFDFVIAADGIRSLAGSSCFPKRELRYSGQTCIRGLLNYKLIEEVNEGSVEIWGNGTRFGLSPVGENKYYWYSTFCQPAHKVIEKSKIKNVLSEIFHFYPNYVRKLIAEINPNDVLQTDIFDLISNDNWDHSRIVFLGDAAHATTPNLGQGAAMAIEDAYVLAEEIGNSTNFKVAFNEFKQKRRDRVKYIVNLSWKIGQMANSTNPITNLIRNHIMRGMPKILIDKQLDKIYRNGLDK